MTKRRPPITRIICSVCDGTGMRAVEIGPRGATWTDYERCYACKGIGAFVRPSGDHGEKADAK
jgi:DnaJ-class molecular chaperone